MRTQDVVMSSNSGCQIKTLPINFSPGTFGFIDGNRRNGFPSLRLWIRLDKITRQRPIQRKPIRSCCRSSVISPLEKQQSDDSLVGPDRCLARCLLEQNTRLIFGGGKVACAAEPTEGVVLEQLRHDEMRLPSRQSFHVCAARNQRERAGKQKSGTGGPLHTQEPVTVASFRTWRGWRECVARDRCLTSFDSNRGAVVSRRRQSSGVGR
jgi:hypothetical protein